MARRSRRVGLAEVKDDFSRFLRLAESEDIVITRHGRPAGVLIGFESAEESRVQGRAGQPTRRSALIASRQTLAITSTSMRAPRGKSLTETVERAGGTLPTCLR